MLLNNDPKNRTENKDFLQESAAVNPSYSDAATDDESIDRDAETDDLDEEELEEEDFEIDGENDEEEDV